MNTKALRQKVLDLAIHGKLVPPACRQAGKSLENIPAEKEGQWFVYVIECVDGSFYKGFTTDLIKRYKQHCAGIGAEWTKTHKPKQLFYWEIHYSEKSAIEREKYLKSGCGREWFKNEVVDKPENWESATVLLEKIRAEKAEKIKKGLPAGRRGELKADKKDSFIFTKECEFDEDKLGKCSSGTRHKRHYEQFADGTVKDIEDEIPFEVPEGWAWCRLGEICEVSSAKRVLQQDWKTSGIPFYRAREIAQLSNNETVKDDLFITFELYNELKQKYGVPIAGDLMVSAVGTIGKVYIVKDTDCFYYKDASVICFSKKEKSIDSLYLKLCCESDFLQEQMYSQSKGTTVDTITINKAQNYLIPLPPIFEQQKIVHSIQDFFGHIGILEQNKSELQFLINAAKSKILDLAIHGKLVPQDPNDEPAEELLKRIATSDNRPYEKVDEEPFEIPDSWRWVKLNDLAEIARGGSPRPIQDYITEDKDGINWIKIGDTIEESKYITSAKEKIKPEGKKHSRFVHAGDFLLTNSMSFGRPYILKIDGCIHDGWLVFANIKECLLQDYLYYALSSAYIYETFSNVAAGSTVKNLKSDTVKQVDFPLPPLSEQKRIVEAIENMYEVLDQIQNNLV